MPLYNFTLEEIEALREVVARVRSGRLGTQSIPRFIDDTTPTPEVYVALTPAGGIPGAGELATGTGSADLATAGSAVCTLCDIANTYAGASGANEIRTLGFSHTVYNLSEVAIPGGRYIVVARLKTGGWVAVGAGGDQGSPTETMTGGACDLASLRPGDCVTVRTTDQGSYRLHWNGNGHWVGADEFAYTGGAGTFDFFYSEGRQRLKLDGLDLLDCGDGCFAGGALTGHSDELGSGTGMGMTGTGTGFAECAGEVFKVCVECSCCLEAGWYCVNLGGGCTPVYLDEDDVCDSDLYNAICSGPYASYAAALAACPAPSEPTPPAPFTCCGSRDIPGDLTVTLPSGCGGPYTISHNGSGTWVYEGAVGSGTLRIEFSCIFLGDPGLTYLRVLCDGVEITSNTALTADCTTYTWTFNLPAWASDCCSSAGGIATVQG